MAEGLEESSSSKEQAAAGREGIGIHSGRVISRTQAVVSPRGPDSSPGRESHGGLRQLETAGYSTEGLSDLLSPARPSRVVQRSELGQEREDAQMFSTWMRAALTPMGSKVVRANRGFPAEGPRPSVSTRALP